jgi:lipopolysaccharide export system permease protein
MIGWTLGRYLFLRYLGTVGYLLLGVISLIFVVTFTQVNDRFSGLPSYTVAIGLKVSALQSPMILQQTLPFIGLFASMALLVQLNRKYELVIARSAGLSAWQFLMPIGLGALFFGMLAIGLINPLASRTFAAAEELQQSFGVKIAGSSSAISVPWLRQSDADGETIIGAKSVLKNGTELVAPVFMIVGNDGNIIARIDAARAVLEPKKWVLIDASTAKHEQAPILNKTLELVTNLTPELVQERLQNPEMIPFFELPQKIAVARALGYQADAFAMQYHSILAMPALLMVMTLIAATVSLKFVRFGQSGAMILGGILAGFMLYVVTVLVKAFGGAGIVSPVLAAWLPVVLAFLFGVSFLLHKEDG